MGWSEWIQTSDNIYWIGTNEFVLRNSSIHPYYSSAYPNAIYYDVFSTCLHVVE